jgi:type I restriction enzyme S subunit
LGRDILTKTQFYIKPGDFLISKRQIIHGACGVVPPELDGALVSNEYATLRVREGLLLRFLDYLSHTVYFQQTCFQSSVGVDVEKMIFSLRGWLKYRVYLPPFEEQQRIVDILSTWDEAITLTEQLIEAKQRRKKALMQQLLTGRRRFNEFEGQPWEITRLGDLGRCIRGVSYRPREDLEAQDTDDTVRLLRANNIAEQRINLDDVQYVVSTRCKDEQYLRQGDIAICMSSGSKQLVGKAAMFRVRDPFEYTVGAFCSIYRTRAGIHSGFVNQLFQSEQYRRELHSLSAGSSINNLKPGDIESIHFYAPSNPLERARIAAILNTCDDEIALLTGKVATLQRQKKGLMQQLLTGRVRVVV